MRGDKAVNSGNLSRDISSVFAALASSYVICLGKSTEIALRFESNGSSTKLKIVGDSTKTDATGYVKGP